VVAGSFCTPTPPKHDHNCKDSVPTIKKTSMYFLLNSMVSLYEYLSDKIEDFLDYFEGPFDVIQELEREQDVGDKLQNANP